jgi:hypothetical protein
MRVSPTEYGLLSTEAIGSGETISAAGRRLLVQALIEKMNGTAGESETPTLLEHACST